MLLLAIAGWGFRFIPQQFMPLLNKQYFSVDVWLPDGTRIEESDRQMTEMTAYLNSLEGVKKVSSFVGQLVITWPMRLMVRSLIMRNVW